MYLRKHTRRKYGKTHAYWELVRSVRTSRGPRQETVAWLGEMDAEGCAGVKAAAEGRSDDGRSLFNEPEPQWTSIDTKRLRVENVREFGGCWIGLEVMKRLGLDRFLAEILPQGRERVPWVEVIKAQILFRLTSPSSELHMAEHLYPSSALEYLLGVPAGHFNDDRLYRALDRIYPHKEALESYLKDRLGNLFELDFDLILYDITSTYFEGEAAGNPQAARGYSRDHRPDCKQVCIGLVVTRGGYPLGYEIFAGNRTDVTTLQDMVEAMESRYGRAQRIWCLDRGMVSQDNISFLQEEGRRYIVGTPRSMLRKFERELLEGTWDQIREGVEVKLCASADGEETYILCRSQTRQKKEEGIHGRFEERIENGLEKIGASCERRRHTVGAIERRVGRLLGRNSRAAGLFDVKVQEQDGRATITWEKVEAWRDWARLSEGCYLLRSNVNDWTAEDLWKAYIQLTDAEEAFRIHKSDLRIRPIWHQKQDRVQAHILVCFLAYVVWKALSGMCGRAGLGDEPRKVLRELSQIYTVDVVAPVQSGPELRIRCISEPSKHQAILLERLKLHLPRRMTIHPLETKCKEM